MPVATTSCQLGMGQPLAERDPLPPEDRAFASGSTKLEALYRRHAGRLLRFFVRRAGSGDAHDLVHETFVRFAGLGDGAGRKVENPEAYLGRVATNLLRDRARRAARRSLDLPCSADVDSIVCGDPHRLLEDRDALMRLEHAVSGLGSRRRRIFLLHRLEHLTYAEIADEVGMSVKGVKKQMAKALFELRRELGPL